MLWSFPPQILASDSGRCCAAGRIAHREGAELSVAVGVHDVPGFISSELENASAYATIDDSALLLGSQSDVASMRRLTAISISRPQFSQDQT